MPAGSLQVAVYYSDSGLGSLSEEIFLNGLGTMSNGSEFDHVTVQLYDGETACSSKQNGSP